MFWLRFHANLHSFLILLRHVMVGKKSVADLNNWLNCSFRLLILFRGSFGSSRGLMLSLPGTLTVFSFSFVCRKQHSLHRDSGPAESPAAHGQSGRFGFPGGPRRGGGSSLRWAAALLQHTLPTVNRTPGSRGGRAEWQVRRLPECLFAGRTAWVFSLQRSDSVTANHMQPQERRKEHFCNACVAAVLC